jgi:hypothetical protein
VSKNAQSTFDVRKELDVLALLKRVHQTPIDPNIKNHVRDLIFTYRQSLVQEDAEKIKQSFAPLGIAIVYDNVSVNEMQRGKKPKKPMLGTARPIPHFEPIAVPALSTPTLSVTKQEDTQAHIQQKPVLSSVPAYVPDESESVQTSHSNATQEVRVPVSSVPSRGGVNAEASERIKEIKRLVNEKVGNPVNLIDSHNELGREYMNALLDAMKKSNGAPSGELSVAMERLEKAFAQVSEEVLNTASAAVSGSEVEEEIAPQVHKEEKPIRVQPKAFDVVPNTPSFSRGNAPLSISSEGSFEVQPEPQMTPVDERVSAPAQVMQSTSQAAGAQEENVLHSVAKEKQLQDLLRTTQQKQVQTKLEREEENSVSMDPLQTPEVTSGLNQLLSEWSLFRSSGLFGTGPGGKDHPLYKKLSKLTMAAVIAGRFEGATAPIKQSITDYMNGWRYEEGILHEHGEFFEHYLRRVVLHILNRKKLK